MSNDAQDDSASDAQTAAGENGEVTATDEEQLQEAEEKRWREELDNHRFTMGDAEEICVFLVDDLLVAIFQEMQVRSENATLFATSAQQMCAQAFESVDMSSYQPADSLDRIPGPTQHELSGRQQILKPHSKWAPSPQSQTRTSDAAVLASSLDQPSIPLVFLRRLLKFLEAHTERTELELLRFPTSEAISSFSGKKKFVGIGNASGSSGDGHGEWCISVDQISAFLQQLLSKGLVSAVPSTIAFVMAVNHESLEKRRHSQGRVTLPHLQQFVQKALLTAEEEEEKRADRIKDLQLQSPRSSSKDKMENESTPRSRIFQTEVPLSKLTFQDVLKGVMEPAKQPEVGPQQDLLSSYQEELPPRAIEMDRRAPGQVRKKAALSAANPSKRAISRKIIMLMAPTPRQGSRWTTVRHKVIVPSAGEAKSDSVVTITAEADMELLLAGDRHQSSTLGSLAERKAKGLFIQTPGAGTIAENEEPDAAALSNIFSLGTPRQLTAQELSRRNDLLAQLEREAAHTRRRATTTIIASMSLGGPPTRYEAVCPSQADHQQFQAYVAANSIVTTVIESDGRSGSLSPTRPERGDQPAAPRNRGRANATRSKFELERDALSFSVSDGNAHVREEQERLAAAMCSPIKRPRPSIAPPSPPGTPGRPIRTASTLAHLPQLDSSRLAVGVSAVVQGVEKRGPRRNPSRKSRLQLHNYSTAFDGVADEAEMNNGGRMPFSPVRTTNSPPIAPPASRAVPGATGADYRLPVIPVMSPIKTSPHRKHVAFKFQNEADKERVPASISPKSHVRQRPSPKVKQPVWEAKTRSPPRARNHHFATGRNFRKLQRYSDDEEESSSARRQRQEEQPSNMFRQPMAAPRRNVLPTASECDDDS